MAHLIGFSRLGADAELRYTPNGDAVASLRLAFNYGQKGQDGNKPSQWVEASLWGKRAEAMAQFLTKGSQVYCVIGDPHIETFEGRNGPGHKLVGKVIEIEFAGGNSDGQRSESSGQARRQNDQQSRPAPSSGGGGGSHFDDLGDDIPFVSCDGSHDAVPQIKRRMARYSVK